MTEALVDREVRSAWDETLQIGFVVPHQGPAGMFGPSCEAAARMAMDEFNADRGVLGRELRLVPIDGGASPAAVADEVDALVSAGAIDAVTGWHISAVRQEVAPRVEGRVPYVYTALYEGGECTPGVFLTGETPEAQLLPALRWMAREHAVRRWFIVGDNYVWPRGSAAAAKTYARQLGVTICGESYVPLGALDYAHTLRQIERSRPDGVLMFLVGEDAVQFNRAFSDHGLDGSIVRLSTLMDESMLLATGAAATIDLYSVAGFFDSLRTEGAAEIRRRYIQANGIQAPLLTTMGESCYEGMRLLAALWQRAEVFDIEAVCTRAERVAYDGPRGSVRLRDNHLSQDVYVAKAEGFSFDVVDRL